MSKATYAIHVKKIAFEQSINPALDFSSAKTWGNSSGMSWSMSELSVAELSSSRTIDPDTTLLRKVHEHYTNKAEMVTKYEVGDRPLAENWFEKFSDIKPLADSMLNLKRFALMQPIVISELLSRMALLCDIDKFELARWLESKTMGYSGDEILKLLDSGNKHSGDFYLKSAREVFAVFGCGRMSGQGAYMKLLKSFDKSKLAPGGDAKSDYLTKLRLRKIQPK